MKQKKKLKNRDVYSMITVGKKLVLNSTKKKKDCVKIEQKKNPSIIREFYFLGIVQYNLFPCDVKMIKD